MPENTFDRRRTLRMGVIGLGSVLVSGVVVQTIRALAVEPGGDGGKARRTIPARRGPSPYGELKPADVNGIALPEGFSSRVVARSGELVGQTSYRWHSAPDGGACFADGNGWIYVSNSEVPGGGGASAIRFDATARIVDARSILTGTDTNCAGGATPWRTWLSCEEVPEGQVYETDPWGIGPAVVRPAMGRFRHEAAACDPQRRAVYLTEDEPAGCFYRFQPTNWGDLSAGELQVLCAPEGTVSGPVAWRTVTDPDGVEPTRWQVPEALHFDGGEGCWYDEDVCYFTTKGDGRIWAYDCARSSIQVAYDDSDSDGASLDHVDNMTGRPGGDLFVAEDGGNLEICVITAQGVVAPFLRVNGQPRSELTGPAFNPAGDRMYFSSQKGPAGDRDHGVTYEITGPFARD